MDLLLFTTSVSILVGSYGFMLEIVEHGNHDCFYLPVQLLFLYIYILRKCGELIKICWGIFLGFLLYMSSLL